MNTLRTSPPLSNRRLSLWIPAVLLLTIMLVAPLWIVEYPPLLDYPNHLARSFVLVHMHDPAFQFSRFFRSDWGFYPYLGADLLLTMLGRIIPIETAGRLFLGLCAIALPGAVWFFLHAIDPGEDMKALWGLVIAHNIFFLEGFLNFDLSIPIGFFALGFWLRWIRDRSPVQWIAALLTFTALYFTHLVAFGIVGCVVIAYLAFAKRPFLDWVFSGVLALPGLGFYYGSSRIGLSNANAFLFHDLAEKWGSLRTFFQGYTASLDLVTFGAIGIWGLAAWWRNPAFRLNRRWIAVAFALFVLFLSIPWMWGEASDLDIRVLPFLFIAVFAGVHAGPRTKWLALIPLLAFTLRTAGITKYFIEAQPQLSGLARSFDIVPRNALVFTIMETDEDPIQRPYTHFWAYGVIRRGWFSPYLFDISGQTPMRIVYSSYTADGFWDLVYKEPPDWRQVQADYDYVWDFGTPRFAAALTGIGDRIYSYGKLEVYRIRKQQNMTAR